MSNDGWESAKKNQGDYPASWKPTEIGEQVEGEIIEIRQVNFQDGGGCDVAEVRGSNGSWSVFMARAALKNQWEELGPSRGDLIRITFLGEKEAKSGRTFFDYEVLVKRNSPKRDDPPPPTDDDNVPF